MKKTAYTLPEAEIFILNPRDVIQTSLITGDGSSYTKYSDDGNGLPGVDWI